MIGKNIMNRKQRYQLTREKNLSGMDCEKIIDTKPTDTVEFCRGINNKKTIGELQEKLTKAEEKIKYYEKNYIRIDGKK